MTERIISESKILQKMIWLVPSLLNWSYCSSFYWYSYTGGRLSVGLVYSWKSKDFFLKKLDKDRGIIIKKHFGVNFLGRSFFLLIFTSLYLLLFGLLYCIYSKFLYVFTWFSGIFWCVRGVADLELLLKCIWWDSFKGEVMVLLKREERNFLVFVVQNTSKYEKLGLK